jgi:stearoyl-CoA desaturase (delta-9 desaturase)
LLTFGEGWHNNHHAHPQSSRHGLAWYELDINWYAIVVLRWLRVVWDVKARNLHTDSVVAAAIPQEASL